MVRRMTRSTHRRCAARSSIAKRALTTRRAAERSLQLKIESQSLFVRTFVELTVAIYHSREGQHERAMKSAEGLAAEADLVGDPQLIASVNNWLGVEYNISQLPEMALLHFETAWQHAEHLPIAELRQIVQLNLASVHTRFFDRHEEAMVVFEKALEWPTKSVNSARQLIFTASRAQALIGTGRPAQAEREILESFEVHNDRVQDDTRIFALDSLAEAQLAQNKVSAALATFEQALALIANKSGAPDSRSQALFVNYSGALRRAGRTTEAQEIINRVIDQLNKSSANNLLHVALVEQAAIFGDLNNTEAARAVRSRAAVLHEQLNSAALKVQNERLLKSLELERSRRELSLATDRSAALQAEATREIQLRWLSLLLAALLLTVGYLLFSRRMQRRVAQTKRIAYQKLEAQVRERTEKLEEQMAEQLEAEVERRHLQSQLAEGEKMRALGQLTAGVAHDFNNLMTAVMLSAEFLKNEPVDDPNTRITLLDDILSATDSAARITSRLLAYARQQPLKPRSLQLDEFLQESAPLFRNTLGERHALLLHSTACKVVVDQGQLTSALLNLLLNAKEAIDDQGTVEVNQVIEHNPENAQDFAVIKVQDTGRGMAPEQIERATEPFYTSKEVGEGAGLGLSMVYGFARQSGGDFDLQSQPGQGTTATLRLPVEQRAQETAAAPTHTRANLLPANLRIMVVEDRTDVLTMLQRSLEHLGLEALALSNADEAWRRLDSVPPPDLLLTDILMPGELDGRDLARRVLQRFPSTAVVLMTGYSDIAEQDESIGAHELLRKPFSIEALETTLARAMQSSSKRVQETPA